MKYNFNGLTQKANEAINNAICSAEKMGHTYIGSEHLLLGLVGTTDSVASKKLFELEIDSYKITEMMRETIGYGTKTKLNPDLMTPRAKHIIEMSVADARSAGKSFVGTEHILSAIINDGDNYAVRFLSALGINPTTVLDKINENDNYSYDTKSRTDNKKQKHKVSIVEQYSRDLTELASSGRLTSVIGRDKEIERVLHILCRKSKNNPCLIGEPGVGKTSIVEGIAVKIANNDVPEQLLGKRILELDLTSMVAGTKYRGDFEERIKSIIDDTVKSQNIILFIDEVHNIVGAGSAEGSTDAANILKPSLTRGDLQIIGATTIAEYRKCIEKDAALERRFQPITVEEPTVEDAINILMGLRNSYEAFHKIRISDDAIIAAVNLSSRYINDRYLPDKAIDLVDEASSRKKLREQVVPDFLKNTEEQIEKTNEDLRKAISLQDFEKAAQLRDRELKLKEIAETQRNNWIGRAEQSPIVLNDEDIKELLSESTGIPVNSLSVDDSEKLLGLFDELSKCVIGQEEAVGAITKAIRRSKIGLKDPLRPIGSFLFLGPTGVGKTELCRALSKQLFVSDNSFIKLDMSEYIEKHSVSKLIGSPPGYVGYDEGGQLTEKVRRHPYSVVLFDEIEKAHPDIYGILLQILDEGVLTDSQGRKVSFKNTVIIMTSNVGASFVNNQNKKLGFINNTSENVKETVGGELKKVFSPEFLNRIDEIIIFNKLDNDVMKKIGDKMLNESIKRLNACGYNVIYDKTVCDSLVDSMKNSNEGARHIKHYIEQIIEDEICGKILDGMINKSDNYTVKNVDGEIIIE